MICRQRLIYICMVVVLIIFLTACTLFGRVNQKDIDDAIVVVDEYLSDVSTISSDYVDSIIGDAMPVDVVNTYQDVSEILSNEFSYEILDADKKGDKIELTVLMENKDLGALMGDVVIENAKKLVAVLASAGTSSISESEQLSMFATSVQDCLSSKEYDVVKKEVIMVVEKVGDNWVVSEGTNVVKDFVTGEMGDYIDIAMQDLIKLISNK